MLQHSERCSGAHIGQSPRPEGIKVSKAQGNVHDHAEGDERTMLLRRILSGIDPS